MSVKNTKKIIKNSHHSGAVAICSQAAALASDKHSFTTDGVARSIAIADICSSSPDISPCTLHVV
jgi:hypothetical protein